MRARTCVALLGASAEQAFRAFLDKQ